MPHRIFIAINLPEEVKGELGKLGDLGGLGEAVKWVKKDNLHLTLLFIGYVRDEEIPQICQIVKETAQGLKPFSLKFERVCYGPPKKMPPRLIWLDLEKKPELVQFAEKLKKEMAQADILRKVENREFSPHITLGRIRTWQWRRIEPEERPDIERELDLQFEVSSIEIMESVLKRTGPEYTILESVKFV